MLNGIIFDMDGVLIDSEPIYYRAVNKTFEEENLSLKDEDFYACVGGTYNTMHEKYSKKYPIKMGKEQFEQTMIGYRNQIIREEGYIEMPGVRELLACLRKKGYLMAVASSSPQNYIAQAMGSLSLDRYFQKLISGETVTRSKPAPDIFLKAANDLGLLPEECVVIEDSTNGMKAAKAAGMKCIAYISPHSGQQQIEIADIAIHQFDEVTEELLKEIMVK